MDELVKIEEKAIDLSSISEVFSQHAEAKDLVLPKILAMQGLSEFVADGKAIMGELRESLEGKLLAAKGEKLEILPLHYTKSWIIFEEEKGQMIFKGIAAYSPVNSDWLWEEVVNGIRTRRDQTINVYVILPSEIKEGIYMPYVISFRRTSYLAGKKFLTSREKLLMVNKPFFFKTFFLSAQQEKNDKGTFYVLNVEVGRNSTGEEQHAIAPWLSTIAQEKVRVDNSDLEKEFLEKSKEQEFNSGEIVYDQEFDADEIAF